jgi:hypothetical protein
MHALQAVEARHVRVVILDLDHVPRDRCTGIVALESLVARLNESGVKVILVGIQGQPLRALARAGWRNRKGRLRIFRSFERGISLARRTAAESAAGAGPRPSAGPLSADVTTRGLSGRARQTKRILSPHLPFLPFIVLSIWIFVVLARVFLLRLSYPLDLEWMEGGVLTHALRLARGQPIYAEPSVDFVSFLYTPLYPAVLAVLSKVFGSLVRASAVRSRPMAFAGALVVLVAAVRGIAKQFQSEELPAVATTAGLLGAAAVCTAFPFCGAFYDLVRGDSLWLFLVSLGLYCCAPGGSTRRIVLGALLLALAFFTKQTAAPFMVAAAASVALTAGIKRGLVFSAVAFGSTTTAILVGQYMTEWMVVDLHRSTPPESRDPVREDLARDPSRLAPLRLRASPSHRRMRPVGGRQAQAVPSALPLGRYGGRGSGDGGRGSATQGAYDNAYIRPSTSVRSCLRRAWSSSRRSRRGSGPRPATPSGPLASPTDPGADRCGPWAFSAWGSFPPHAMIRWLDPSPTCPAGRTARKRGGSWLNLTNGGPEVFVPCHPFYSVLAGGRGHLHVDGSERRLFLAARDHRRPCLGCGDQGEIPRERGELLRVQAVDEGHPSTTAPRLGSSGWRSTTPSSRISPEAVDLPGP